jgi:hypothetical protein
MTKRSTGSGAPSTVRGGVTDDPDVGDPLAVGDHGDEAWLLVKWQSRAMPLLRR